MINLKDYINESLIKEGDMRDLIDDLCDARVITVTKDIDLGPIESDDELISDFVALAEKKPREFGKPDNYILSKGTKLTCGGTNDWGLVKFYLEDYDDIEVYIAADMMWDIVKSLKY